MLKSSRTGLLVPLLCGASLAALVGCTGDIAMRSTGGGSTSSTDPSTSGDPGGSSSNPGGATTPIAPDAPSTCGGMVGPSPMHRLTHIEYDNTIRDLIGEDMNLSKDFSEDEKAGDFFANYFTPITEMQFSQYATAAEAVAEKAVTAMTKLVPCDPTADPSGCGAQFIKQFGRRVYRRPLADDEMTTFQQLFELGRTGVDFANGVRLVVQAMLQSPKFIYLEEGPGPLTQHQMAARLSYFLWQGPPDAQLSAVADAGQLGTIEAIRTQAKRLLADKRAADMTVDFHNQWLNLENWMTKDDTLYPTFNGLLPAIIEETSRFVSDAMATDGGKLETLLTSPSSIVNGPLAALYGMPAGGSADWHKVSFDPSQRAGLLTQAAFLSANGAFDGSSPIRRGLAVRERIFCAPMPTPPPGADANFPPPMKYATTRQRFDSHRTNPTCASCHALMDKLGYAYESYDGIGAYRTTENGIKVDSSGEVIGTDVDGTFQNAPELGRKLLGSKQVQQCVATQWFRYAMGRLDSNADKCELDSLYKKFSAGGFKTADLLSAIVESDSFRTYKAVQ